jgi:hypothetical protein
VASSGKTISGGGVPFNVILPVISAAEASWVAATMLVAVKIRFVIFIDFSPLLGQISVTLASAKSGCK